MPTAHPPIRHRYWWVAFFILLFVTIYVVRWHVQSLSDEVRREGMSSRLTTVCRDVLEDHLDIETGLRGMLAGGNVEFLQPYHEGLGRLGRHMAVLQSLVRGDAVEQGYFAKLGSLSESINTEFLAQVRLFEGDGVGAAVGRFRGHPTKPIMDAIRDQLASIEAEEASRMKRATDSLDRSMTATIRATDGLLIVAGAIILSLCSGWVKPPIGETGGGTGVGGCAGENSGAGASPGTATSTPPKGTDEFPII